MARNIQSYGHQDVLDPEQIANPTSLTPVMNNTGGQSWAGAKKVAPSVPAYPGTNSSTARFAQREQEKTKGDNASIGGTPEEPGFFQRVENTVKEYFHPSQGSVPNRSMTENVRRMQAKRDSSDRAMWGKRQAQIDAKGGFKGTAYPENRNYQTTALPPRYYLDIGGATAGLPPEANTDRMRDSTDQTNYINSLEHAIGETVNRTKGSPEVQPSPSTNLIGEKLKKVRRQ